MSTNFEVVDIPAGVRGRSKYADLKDALISLPFGKSIKVPMEMFRGHSPNAVLQMKRYGRKLHVKRSGNDICLWLEPLPTEECNHASQS